MNPEFPKKTHTGYESGLGSAIRSAGNLPQSVLPSAGRPALPSGVGRKAMLLEGSCAAVPEVGPSAN